MTPDQLLDDHRRRPRNLGKLLNAQAVGDVGSIVIGDALRFYIQIQDERIVAARFQVFNCAEQVGPTSAFTELVIGKTLDEARAIGIPALAAHLGVEVTALPVRLWAAEGLRAAVAAWRGDELEHDHDLDPLLCRCHGIAEETVRQSIQVMKLETVEAVTGATGAGSGCGSCKADIPRLLDEAQGKGSDPEPAPPAAGTRVAGRIPTMHRINALLAERLLPDLRRDGGGLELWDLDGGTVVVVASGSLLSDEAARRGALAALEQLLRTEIDPSLGVAEKR